MPTPNVVTYLDSTAAVPIGAVGVTTGTLPAPATLADGDFLFAIVRLQDATLKALTMPTGWTQVQAAGGTGSFAQMAFYFIWKRVPTASAEPANYTWDWTGQGAARFGGIIHRYSGVHASSGPWAGSVCGFSFASTLPSQTYTCTTAGQGIWAYGGLNSNLGIVAPPTYTKRSTLNPAGDSSYTVADRPDQPGTLTTGTGSSTANDGQVVFAGTLVPAHTNVAPTAVAGADLYAEPNEEVFLDGTGSSDPEGILSAVWTQTSGPTVQIYGLGSLVSFYAPSDLAGVDLGFTLTVTDTSLAVATDTMVVHVAPPSIRKLSGGTWQAAPLLLIGVERPNIPSAAIVTFISNFSTLAGFTSSGSEAAIVSNQLSIDATPGYPVISSAAKYDLTNSAIYAQLVTAPNVGNGSVQTFLTLFDSTGNQIDIGWSGGSLVCNQVAGSVTSGFTTTYTSGTDVWLRISHDGTNIIWATSPDATTWTTKRTAAPTVPLTRLQVLIRAGNYSAEPTPGAAVWDNLNNGAVLLFEDTFDGSAGTAPDTAKWNYEYNGGTYADTGAGTFNGRNSELQYYTNNDRDNAQLDGAGALDIILLAESIGGKAYSSAMLHTNGKFNFTSGYVEAQIATPVGSGVWPAFWTEGSGTSWPSHGEVDIMEQVNSDNFHNVNVHGGPTHWSDYYGQAFTRNSATYHVYGALITSTKVEFYLDNVLIHTTTPADMPGGQTWPFGTTSQFIRMNVAMGGSFPGTPDGSATLPMRMKVKTVRVWDRKPISPLT